MPRITEEMAGKVRHAIELLPIPQAIKDEIQWDVVPFLQPDPQNRDSVMMNFMVGLGLPVPDTGDHEINFHPVGDPYNEAEISQIVRLLYGAVQQAVDARAAQRNAAFNGHKTSPGGLLLPD